MSAREPWFGALRERVWFAIARFAVVRANRHAPLHYGLEPYVLHYPIREPEMVARDSLWAADSQS